MTNHEKQSAEELYEAFSKHDREAWLAKFSPTSIWRDVPSGQIHVGASGQEDNYAFWSTPFPNGTVKDVVVHAGDGFAVCEVVGVGTHEGPLQTPGGVVEATGVSASIAICDVHKFSEDGLIVETHRYWDLAGAAAQLGL
ncbi:hypothetical protein Aph01nite_19750 [Acrocarpospora phusangensis]|uniref:SnoaL-like domain-containing protein n=1 Tax=Acrocarpospora phusangensis TaxID=1070424 RepID=A0A919QBL3_9ACTN|nr:nuclear transport factor 2 family protein [Acrocarpospora phusangensis]GIH23665.1 hypothetical protein Aph01nite_19750 [Acrocarpospora phusangensis]